MALAWSARRHGSRPAVVRPEWEAPQTEPARRLFGVVSVWDRKPLAWRLGVWACSWPQPGWPPLCVSLLEASLSLGFSVLTTNVDSTTPSLRTSLVADSRDSR